jgi:hypothetical protein
MNAAEAQTEVAIHLAEAQRQLARAVQAWGDYLYLSRIRQQLEEKDPLGSGVLQLTLTPPLPLLTHGRQLVEAHSPD